VLKKLEGDNKQESAILLAISSGIHDSTELLRGVTLETTEFQKHMTMLEINGKVYENEIGGWHIK